MSDYNKSLPDIWFDWFARLLPGLFMTGLGFYLFKYDFTKLENNSMIIIFFGGYILGHLVQPYASHIINWQYKYYNNKLYPRTEPIISKSYAETVGMLSSAMLTFFILIAYFIYTGEQNQKISWFKIFVCITFIVFFLVATQLKAVATDRKIDNLKPKFIAENDSVKFSSEELNTKKGMIIFLLENLKLKKK